MLERSIEPLDQKMTALRLDHACTARGYSLVAHPTQPQRLCVTTRPIFVTFLYYLVQASVFTTYHDDDPNDGVRNRTVIRSLRWQF
jgi:hypothetical protein